MTYGKAAVERTTIYLPAHLQRSLREVARRTGRPQAELVREALTAYLETQRQPPMRSIGFGADDELAGRNSEAWLDEAGDRP